jgi:hypothetical protein
VRRMRVMSDECLVAGGVSRDDRQRSQPHRPVHGDSSARVEPNATGHNHRSSSQDLTGGNGSSHIRAACVTIEISVLHDQLRRTASHKNASFPALDSTLVVETVRPLLLRRRRRWRHCGVLTARTSHREVPRLVVLLINRTSSSTVTTA